MNSSTGYYMYSTDLSSALYDNAWHQIVFILDNRDTSAYIYVDAVDINPVVLETAQKYIDIGVNRLGSSSGIDIVSRSIIRKTAEKV